MVDQTIKSKHTPLTVVVCIQDEKHIFERDDQNKSPQYDTDPTYHIHIREISQVMSQKYFFYGI